MSDFGSLCLYLLVYGISAISIGLWCKRKIWIAGILGLALPIIMAALRYSVGSDFWTYIQMWHGTDMRTYTEILRNFYQEPGFYLISKFTFDYGDERCYFGICAALTLIPVIVTSKNQFSASYLPVFSFLFLLTNFTSSFNIIRQCVAVSFTFVASQYIFKRNLWKFAFWILIAMMFHLSAIIFAPAYLIFSKGKFINLRRGVILGIVFIGVLFATSLIDSLSSVDGFERYSVYSASDDRARNRSIFLSVFLLIAYLARRKRMVKIDSRTDTYLIFTIIALLIETTGSITPFIKRSGLYFSIYSIPLACIWIKSFGNKQIMAKIFILTFFLARFIISTYILGQANIIPYNTKETYQNVGNIQA